MCIQIICSNLCLHGLGMIPHLCVLLTPEQIALDGSKTVSTDCIGMYKYIYIYIYSLLDELFA
jgi:hypothetical protein